MSGSKDVFDQFIKEVAEEDDEITEEQLSDFFYFYWEGLREVFRDPKHPIVYVPKFGTFKPIPEKIWDRIITIRDKLDNEVLSQPVMNKLLDELKILVDNINRIEKEVYEYGRKNG